MTLEKHNPVDFRELRLQSFPIGLPEIQTFAANRRRTRNANIHNDNYRLVIILQNAKDDVTGNLGGEVAEKLPTVSRVLLAETKPVEVVEVHASETSRRLMEIATLVIPICFFCEMTPHTLI